MKRKNRVQRTRGQQGVTYKIACMHTCTHFEHVGLGVVGLRENRTHGVQHLSRKPQGIVFRLVRRLKSVVSQHFLCNQLCIMSIVCTAYLYYTISSKRSQSSTKAANCIRFRAGFRVYFVFFLGQTWESCFNIYNHSVFFVMR